MLPKCANSLVSLPLRHLLVRSQMPTRNAETAHQTQGNLQQGRLVCNGDDTVVSYQASSINPIRSGRTEQKQQRRKKKTTNEQQPDKQERERDNPKRNSARHTVPNVKEQVSRLVDYDTHAKSNAKPKSMHGNPWQYRYSVWQCQTQKCQPRNFPTAFASLSHYFLFSNDNDCANISLYEL